MAPLHPRPERPLTGPDAWRGAELTESDWLHRFTQAELADLERALAVARATGKDLATLVAADFPLEAAAPLLARVRAELLRGRGFAVLRGLDPRA